MSSVVTVLIQQLQIRIGLLFQQEYSQSFFEPYLVSCRSVGGTSYYKQKQLNVDGGYVFR